MGLLGVGFFFISTLLARAEDSLIQFSPVALSGGYELSTATCPCMRWSFSFQVGSGKWETEHFLISSSGLAKIRALYQFDMRDFAAGGFNAGAIEVLYKQGHVGIGFDGITVGQNSDLDTATSSRPDFMHWSTRSLRLP